MLLAALAFDGAFAQAVPKTVVSRATSGAATANALSTAVTMTPDGRWVLFSSQATNLVAGQVDAAASTDAFVYDRQNLEVILVSRAAGSVVAAANGESFPRAISDDGRYVVYQTLATDVVAGVADSNGVSDVYLFDRQTGSSRLVSHSAASLSETANGSSTAFNHDAIDATGAFVLFQSRAPNVISGISDTNNVEDIFLFNVQTGERTLVSRSTVNPNAMAAMQSLPQQISPGGQYILFLSSAPDLVTGVTDGNNTFDGFLFDRLAGSSFLITSASGQSMQTADGQMNSLAMTSDARWFVVHTRARNMVPGQIDGVNTDDLFLLDRQTGSRRLLTGVNGSQTQTLGANNVFSRRQMSSDGRYLVISTQGATLVSGVVDNNAAYDLFLYDRDAATTVLITGANGSTQNTANGLSGFSRISQDGRQIVFSSAATNLLSGLTDTNGAIDTFQFDRETRALKAVSTASGAPNTTANGQTLSVLNSQYGDLYLLETEATNLSAAVTDSNSGSDVVQAGTPVRLFSDSFESN